MAPWSRTASADPASSLSDQEVAGSSWAQVPGAGLGPLRKPARDIRRRQPGREVEALRASQPRRRISWSWASLYTTSATPDIPRARASPTIAVTIATARSCVRGPARRRAVDLESVERKAHEIAERRVSRSKVVEQRVDPTLLACEQLVDGRRQVVHQRRLRDFDAEPVGGEPTGAKRSKTWSTMSGWANCRAERFTQPPVREAARGHARRCTGSRACGRGAVRTRTSG
jgi:hypothetical protein